MKLKDLYMFDRLHPDGVYGVEIEMEGGYLHSTSPHGWVAHGDGSLRGEESIEMVLTRPMRPSTVASKIEQLYDHWATTRAKLMPSPRCGVHIHMNCQEYTLDQIWRIVILYLIFEDVLVKWCGPDREGNMFCLRSRDADMLIVNIMEDMMRGGLHRTQDGDKYSSININALHHLGSLEFRAMRTPDKPERIIKWLEILRCIEAYALGGTTPEDWVLACSTEGGRVLTETVFGELATEFLSTDRDALILEGVRRVQPLVYVPQLI